MLTILYPWECSEYPHKYGHVSLGILIQRNFQDCYVKTITKLYKTDISTQFVTITLEMKIMIVGFLTHCGKLHHALNLSKD